MENAGKKPHIDLDTLDNIQDIDALRAALRSALEQTRSDAARLKVWENKAGELEGARRGFLSLMSQLSESRRLAAEAQEALQRMQQLKDSILAHIPGGTDAREALLRMLEAKNAAENKTRLLELEKEACASRLREWEAKAADFENLRKNTEDRENRNRNTEKSLLEKEAALEQRALALENEHARRRKELDEFKERLRAEVAELKAHDGRPREKDTLV